MINNKWTNNKCNNGQHTFRCLTVENKQEVIDNIITNIQEVSIQCDDCGKKDKFKNVYVESVKGELNV